MPQRIAALSKLQSEEDAFHKELQEAITKLRVELHAKAAHVRERRAALVSGAALTEDERGLAPVEDYPDVLDESDGPQLHGFWREIMERVLSVPGAGAAFGVGEDGDFEDDAEHWLSQRDLDVLEHLLDVRVEGSASDSGDGSTLRMTFKFAPNPFLEDESLTVAFERDSVGELLRTDGCTLRWKPGCDPTKEQRGREPFEVPSFFHLFAPCESFDDPGATSP